MLHLWYLWNIKNDSVSQVTEFLLWGVKISVYKNYVIFLKIDLHLKIQF